MLLDAPLRACLTLIVLAAPVAAQSATPQAAPASTPAAAPASAAEAAVIAAQKPSYPMNSCLACGKVWSESDTPLDIVRLGRLARVCNAECGKAFDPQAAKLFKVLDDQIIAAQSASYPLTQCPVTGDELGRKPKFLVLGTRLVEVCCGDCRKELQTDHAAADAALAKIDAALITAQSGSYARTTCVVDDKPLGDAPVQRLYGVTLVRFCSDGCEAKFKADPQAFHGQVDALHRAAPGKAASEAPPPAAGEGQPRR